MVDYSDRSGNLGRGTWKAASYGDVTPNSVTRDAVDELWKSNANFDSGECRKFFARKLDARMVSWIQGDADADEKVVFIPLSQLVALVRAVSDRRESLLQRPAAELLEGLEALPSDWDFVVDYTSSYK